MTDQERLRKPGGESFVDVTIEPEEMVAARDELRLHLVAQYHILMMEARANRKVGNHAESRQQEKAAQRQILMIWTLDNPMKDLTPRKKREE